jgi:protein-disulfide isomerase
LDREALLALAVSIGFDASRFNNCMQAVEVEQAIQKDISVGRAAGVNATPTFFINKRRVSNAAELDGAIQDALTTLNVTTKE